MSAWGAAMQGDRSTDFVWDSMLDYWQGTGQVGPGLATTTGLSEREFNALAYNASYGPGWAPLWEATPELAVGSVPSGWL
ncbi:MAG: hypothetical protein GY724_26115 [Actinomycetia bacterium]|nr:hypothetical protein [Actinomycetes bacterium]